MRHVIKRKSPFDGTRNDANSKEKATYDIFVSGSSAERTGFEPADQFPGHRFSKPALSTTQPPLQSRTCVPPRSWQSLGDTSEGPLARGATAQLHCTMRTTDCTTAGAISPRVPLYRRAEGERLWTSLMILDRSASPNRLRLRGEMRSTALGSSVPFAARGPQSGHGRPRLPYFPVSPSRHNRTRRQNRAFLDQAQALSYIYPTGSAFGRRRKESPIGEPCCCGEGPSRTS